MPPPWWARSPATPPAPMPPARWTSSATRRRRIRPSTRSASSASRSSTDAIRDRRGGLRAAPPHRIGIPIIVSAIRIARLSIAVAVLLAGVWMFLPTSLGGSATYVSTFGTSMEPGFHTGDLAVLRPAGSYDVGDVIAYRSDSLNTTVMHRIVERDGDRFVTQGDNNSWLDEDQPTTDQVMGALWFRVPQGGKALAALRSPALVFPVTVAIGA